MKKEPDTNSSINTSQKPHVKWKKPDTINKYYAIPFTITF